MNIYQNPHIYTKTKEYFTLKNKFSVNDIKTWLSENEEEYNKIYQGSESCNDCNSNIRDIGSDDPFTFCAGNPPTEEYKFYDFYKNISSLRGYFNRNTDAKLKLQEYEKIINNDEKVREWLIENEEDYYSFWKDNSHHIVNIGGKYLYYFKPIGEIEYIKFYIEKESFEYSFALSNLFEILYPKDYDVFNYYQIIKNKNDRNFNSKYLKPFTEKDTFSIEELSTWLEESQNVKELTSVKYSTYERFESIIIQDVKKSLNYNLPILQDFLKPQKFLNPRENMGEFNSEEWLLEDINRMLNKKVIHSIVEELKATGMYAIHKNKWFEIKIIPKELEPLFKLFEDENEEICPF